MPGDREWNRYGCWAQSAKQIHLPGVYAARVSLRYWWKASDNYFALSSKQRQENTCQKVHVADKRCCFLILFQDIWSESCERCLICLISGCFERYFSHKNKGSYNVWHSNEVGPQNGKINQDRQEQETSTCNPKEQVWAVFVIQEYFERLFETCACL